MLLLTLPFPHYYNDVANFPGEQPLFYIHFITFYFPKPWEFLLPLWAQFFTEKDINGLKTTIWGVFGRDGSNVITVGRSQIWGSGPGQITGKDIKGWHKPCGSFQKFRGGSSVVKVDSKRQPWHLCLSATSEWWHAPLSHIMEGQLVIKSLRKDESKQHPCLQHLNGYSAKIDTALHAVICV